MAYAVLMDSMSIQKYVFGSNKLKENLGASFIVGKIYDEIADLIYANKGYIGGGNAFFISESDPREKIKVFSRNLLVHYPGISLAVAIDDNFEGNFRESFNKLHKKLQESKNTVIPNTNIPSHGINVECTRTGYSADTFLKAPKEWEEEFKDSYISSVSAVKLMEADNAQKDSIKLLSDCGLNEKYIFTDNLDKLGQDSGEDSHIAVVHIDGNGMGDIFKALDSLDKIKTLSKDIEFAVSSAFQTLLMDVVQNVAKIEKDIKFTTDIRTGKKILPIRPIILGGDDVTFVCDGRLGIYFAKVYMDSFAQQNNSENIKLTSCAGVAIVKTKYPFYRAYELAEKLCHNAKQARKANKDNGSWLDYHLSYGGISGEIKEIREKYYKSADGNNLLKRPYKTEDLVGVFANVAKLKNEMSNSNSKVKELREILTLDLSRRSNFYHQLKFRGIKLPYQGETNPDDFFDKSGTTPYFDLIELSELLPEHLI